MGSNWNSLLVTENMSNVWDHPNTAKLEVCKSDRIRSDFGTKIFISDRIDTVVS